ncbi:MAG: hypothetical protein EOP35_17155 [Rubrivivax sp.]|nr:MAG: hypothetical protein EOP35_17155 [Rubrivivax sp.]
MPTYAKQLLDAVQASQSTQVAIPASSIHLERMSPIADDECPALNILVGQARKVGVLGSEGGYDLLDMEVDVVISIHTRGAPRTRVADPFVDAVNAALMRDPSLGGLAVQLGLYTVQPRQAAAGETGIAELTYRARCAVRESDLSIFTH